MWSYFSLELIPEKVDVVGIFVGKKGNEEILCEVESITKLDVVRDDSVEVVIEEVSCSEIDLVFDVLLDGVIEVNCLEDSFENGDAEINGFLELAKCEVEVKLKFFVGIIDIVEVS